MCTGLISLLLATLMQTLKNRELAKNINDACLAVLVEESANLLLDPRIATVGIDSVDGLDQTQREQIQRATNKLAIMAIISAPTHESVIALMRLQDKFCQQIPTGDDGSDKNARLAKIMTKLMARGVKSESSKAVPFDGFDMEAFLCAVADLVKAARDMKHPQATSSCHLMAKTIVTAVIKAKGSATPIRDSMMDCALTKQDEPLIWELVESCEAELGLAPALVSQAPEEEDRLPGTSTGNGDETKRFGELIAEGAGATDAISKQRFKSRLLAFVSAHPNLDIDAQLVPLSEHFRAFILECLGRPGDDVLRSKRYSGREEARASSSNQFFKDRLDQIKANLQTTEDFVQSSSSPTPRTAGLALSGSTSSSVAAASTLRARLAASRAATSSPTLAPSQSVDAGASSARAEDGEGGGAAALRARLNRLKSKKESGN